MAKQHTIEEALDYCLVNPEHLSAQQLLDKFPEHGEKLQPLLTVANSIGGALPPPVPAERKAAMKQRLMAAAAGGAVQRGTASVDLREAPLAAPYDGGVAIEPAQWPLRFATPLKRVAWAASVAAVALLMVVWWSSARALADSPFYDVKLTSENAMLNLAPDPSDRALGHASLAMVRLDDIRAMAATGKLPQAGKAVDNFDHHVTSSIAALQQVSGEERTQVARELYVRSLEGTKTLSSIQNAPGVSAQLNDELADALKDALKCANDLKLAASEILELAGVDIDTIPTPYVSPVAIATATPEPGKPVVAGRSPTGVVAQGSSTRPPSGAGTTGTSVIAVPPVTKPANTRTVAKPTARATVAPTAPRVPASPTKLGSPIVRATLTRTPAPAATATAAGRPATRTPASTRIVPPFTPTRAPTSVAGPPTLTDTPIAIVRTPIPTPAGPPPTNTPTNTPTETPIWTPEPTYTPVPATPTVPPVPTANVCDLRVDQVDVSCASGDSVSWSAQVNNTGPGPVTLNWTAELLVQLRGGGGFQPVDSQHGSSEFSPGDTTVQDSISYDFPAEANNMKVRFSLENSGTNCNPQSTSPSRRACTMPSTSTPESRPTNTPRPTHTPRPTRTPRG